MVRHVMIDAPSNHFPNRIEIEIHTDAKNLTRSTSMSVLRNRPAEPCATGAWRRGVFYWVSGPAG
jgi:hypothetical protein